MKPYLFSVNYAGSWGPATLDLETFIAKGAAQRAIQAIEQRTKTPR